MAIVKTLRLAQLETESAHLEVECTYSLVNDDGVTCLQVDTYGSKQRKIPGKKSQSIRFTPAAIRQLKEILAKHFA